MTHYGERFLGEIPANPAQFFPWLKHTSEQAWKQATVKDHIYGFQVQPGTRWNPGLTPGEIAQYEVDLGFAFPEIFKQFLGVMNGTDTDAVNIYGGSGEPPRNAPGYYAYPKDLARVREMIAWIYEECHLTTTQVDTDQIPHIMPVVSHRFLVVDRCPTNPILSMYGSDIIPYSANLMNFLVDDIFFDARQDPRLPADLQVQFWLGDMT